MHTRANHGVVGLTGVNRVGDAGLVSEPKEYNNLL